MSSMTKLQSDSDLDSQLDKWQLQLRKGVLIYMVLNLLNRQ